MELRDVACDLPDATKIAGSKMFKCYAECWFSCKPAIGPVIEALQTVRPISKYTNILCPNDQSFQTITLREYTDIPRIANNCFGVHF